MGQGLGEGLVDTTRFRESNESGYRGRPMDLFPALVLFSVPSCADGPATTSGASGFLAIPRSPMMGGRTRDDDDDPFDWAAAIEAKVAARGYSSSQEAACGAPISSDTPPPGACHACGDMATGEAIGGRDNAPMTALLITPIGPTLWTMLVDAAGSSPVGGGGGNAQQPATGSPPIRVHALVTGLSANPRHSADEEEAVRRLPEAMPSGSHQAWLPAQLLGSFSCPAAAAALAAAAAAVAGGGWQLGWALTPPPPNQLPPLRRRRVYTGGEETAGDTPHAHPPPPPPPLAEAHTSYAVMRVVLPRQMLRRLPRPAATTVMGRSSCGEGAAGSGASCGEGAVGSGASAGLRVHVLGSPFGHLAPGHFGCCTVGGIVSSVLPQPPVSSAARLLASRCCSPPESGVIPPCWSSSPPTLVASSQLPRLHVDTHPLPAASLLMLDAPCLPGMEGALVIPALSPAPRLVTGGRPDDEEGWLRDSPLPPPPPPLGVLCCPLSRPRDGVQVCILGGWVFCAWGLSCQGFLVLGLQPSARGLQQDAVAYLDPEHCSLVGES